METQKFYNSREWAECRERVRERDGGRCVLAWLLGNPCSGPLHVHHIEPIVERPDIALEESNCVSSCEAHHPMLEGLRRFLRAKRGPRRCPHDHRTRAGREACERSLNSAA